MWVIFSQRVKRFSRIEIAAPATLLRANFQRGVTVNLGGGQGLAEQICSEMTVFRSPALRSMRF